LLSTTLLPKRHPRRPQTNRRRPHPQPMQKPRPRSPRSRVDDDAEIERDELGRGVLAIALGRRLHRIWRLLNRDMPAPASPAAAAVGRLLHKIWPLLDRFMPPPAPPATAEGRLLHKLRRLLDRAMPVPASAAVAERDNARAAFVMHLDAPWGGGKTTFANFVARVMNPYGFEHGPESFLRVRYGDPKEKNLSAIFLQDPPSDGANPGPADKPEEARRPWIIVPFNAWQVEHVSPPWWVFYQTIRKRCFATVLGEGTAPVNPKDTKPPSKPDLRERLGRVGRWIVLWTCEYFWRLTNPKVTTLLLTALVSSVALVLLYKLGIVHLAGKPNEQRVLFNVLNGIGLVLAGISTVGAIWGFGALFTESIIPGTNTLAERLSLERRSIRALPPTFLPDHCTGPPPGAGHR